MLDPSFSQRWHRPILTLGVLLLCGAGARGGDWPQWLGERGDSIWRETGILERFPKGGPKDRWRVPIGPGYTGPAVAGGRVYVMDRQRPKVAPPPKDRAVPRKGGSPGSERVLCLNAADGKLVWKHEYDCTYKIGYPSGPRTTPLVHQGKVYTLGAMGDLLCLDAANGKVLWARNFVKDFKAPVPVWGWSASPVLDGNRLFCLVGGKDSVVVAFDKDSGKELWKALSAEEIGYAPPIVVTAGGKRQLVVWHTESVNGLDPETGKAYWSQPYPTKGKPQRPGVSIATPRQTGDLLFVTSFYHGALMLRLDADKPAASVVWKSKIENPGKADALNAVMMTPFVKDGYIYGVGGYAQFRCLKADTGEQKWETLAATGGKKVFLGTAFLVQQGGRFFIFNDLGDLIIARLTPKGYEEIDRAHVIEPTQDGRGRDVVWCHPAFADRCLFVRNDKEIVCLSLAAK